MKKPKAFGIDPYDCVTNYYESEEMDKYLASKDKEIERLRTQIKNREK
jgi:hypothetical protein